MAATPPQKVTLEAMLLELQNMNVELASQGADIAANTAAVLALAADLERTKGYVRWTAEYQAGQDPELVDIEAGTHVFPV
jgi:hypothetical protein